MTRRNLLLASTTTPPTTELQFPVYLVEGDNGQLGIDVYNYLIEKYCPEALNNNSGGYIHLDIIPVEEIYGYNLNEYIQINLLTWNTSSSQHGDFFILNCGFLEHYLYSDGYYE